MDSLPDTPVGRQAAWFFHHSETYGRDLTVEEIAEHMRFDASWTPENSPERFREEQGEVRILNVEEASPYELVVDLVFVSEPEKPWLFTFRVYEEAPYLITWLHSARDVGAGIVIREAKESEGPELADLERRSPLRVGDVSITYDRGDDFFAFARLMEETLNLVAEEESPPAGLWDITRQGSNFLPRHSSRESMSMTCGHLPATLDKPPHHFLDLDLKCGRISWHNVIVPKLPRRVQKRRPPQGVTAEVRFGDAFDLIEQVAEESVDLILTSPPYWGLRSYGLKANQGVLEQWTAAGHKPLDCPEYQWYRDAGGVLGLEPYPDWYVDHLVEFFGFARRVLKPAGNVWVNLGDTYFARWSSIRDNGRQGYNGGRLRRRTPAGGYLHDKQLLLIPARFAIAMQEAGWILRNDLIWAKPNVMPRPETDRLRLSHEHWLHFVQRQTRGRPKYYYNMDGTEAGARDVVVCPAERGSDGHTATFPRIVVSPRIVSSCPKGGLVLDPFCGTGRAVSEAVSLRRRGLGFEMSKRYAATARRRVKQAQLKTASERP